MNIKGNIGGVPKLVYGSDLKSDDENHAGSSPAAPTSANDNLLCVSMRLNMDALCQPHDAFKRYVLDSLARLLVDLILDKNKLDITVTDSIHHLRKYVGKVYVFTPEEMKIHDQDIIEEFVDRG